MSLLATNVTFYVNTINTGQTAPVTGFPTPASILIHLNSQENNPTQTNRPEEKTNKQKPKTKQKQTNQKQNQKTSERTRMGRKKKNKKLNQIISHALYTKQNTYFSFSD